MKKIFSARADSLFPPILLAIIVIALGWLATLIGIFGKAQLAPSFLQTLVISFQVVSPIAAVCFLILAIYRDKRAQRQRARLTKELAHSQQQYLLNRNDENTAISEQAAVEQLTESLRQAADFTRKVAQGESAIEWPGMDDNLRSVNQTTLAGELLRMREQMDQVRAGDQVRFWATEGLSKVAEITRQHQGDVQLLSDQLLTYLVRYLKANQGMLFFWDEEHQRLTLASCYAYDRKKFIEQHIEPGEGLVGQTFLEQETTHFTEIPPSYMSITSGLGKASPSSLLLVPLKVNEQTIGILELASFGTFAEHTITFLEEAGEIIASSVATAQLNQKTESLLAQSQQQAEEMRAQEEEMRQNMEELQATQEEMERKTQELYRAKEELEEKSKETEAVRIQEQQRAEEQIAARNKMLIETKKRFEERERELLNQINTNK